MANYMTEVPSYERNNTWCQPNTISPRKVCPSSNVILREKLLQEIYSALVAGNIISEEDESGLGNVRLDTPSVVWIMMHLHFITADASESDGKLLSKMFLFLDPSLTGFVTTRSFTLFVMAVFGISYSDVDEFNTNFEDEHDFGNNTAKHYMSSLPQNQSIHHSRSRKSEAYKIGRAHV